MTTGKHPQEDLASAEALQDLDNLGIPNVKVDLDISRHVGDFIRDQRERAGMTLRRLADKAGVSNPYLSQIERGLRKPSAEILKKLSRALEISATSLYHRAGLIEEGPNAATVIDAIEADKQLSAQQKKIMADLYRSLIVESAHRQGAKE